MQENEENYISKYFYFSNKNKKKEEETSIEEKKYSVFSDNTIPEEKETEEIPELQEEIEEKSSLKSFLSPLVYTISGISISIIAMVCWLSYTIHQNSIQTSIYLAEKATSLLTQCTLEQIIKNKGIKDLSSSGLKKYFEEVIDEKCDSSENQLSCSDGISYTFYGNGECKYKKCYIIIDINGQKGPNKFWTENKKPQDQITINLLLDDIGIKKYLYIERPQVINSQK